MVSEQIAKYPDYLLEFEDIAALAQWQRLVISEINVTVASMKRYLKLDYASNEEWETLLCKPLGTSNTDSIKLLHRTFSLTTWEVLENYIGVWLTSQRGSVEYDKDTLTVKMKVKKAYNTRNFRKWTRNVLPCNMLLEVEVTE